MRDLTAKEAHIVQLLGDAWNLHQELEMVHPADESEFNQAIHAAQNIVLARPATEAFRDGLV